MANLTLGQFITHIASVQANLAHHNAHAFERVARVVAEEAKSIVGHYQEAAGPFVAWAELAQSTKDERVKLGFTENDPGLRSGEMRDSIEHASDATGAVIGSNNEKLKWFELGGRRQPPRSVLGTAVVHKEPEITRILGGAYEAALMGREVAGGSFKIK